MSVWVRFFWKMSFGTKLTATKKKVLCCAELFFYFRIEDKGLWTSTKLFWGLFSHSVTSESVTPGTATRQASLSFTISWSLLRLTSLSRWCHPTMSSFFHLLLPLTSILPSIKVFSNDSALCIRWPNYWSFSFSISCSNKYSGMISFRIDWFDLLAVQGTLKSLLQNHSSKASVYFALSLLYAPALTPILDNWNNHSFDYMDLCWQVKSLLLNMLSMFVIAFLPRSKCLLISWLQSPSTVIWSPRK